MCNNFHSAVKMDEKGWTDSMRSTSGRPVQEEQKIAVPEHESSVAPLMAVEPVKSSLVHLPEGSPQGGTLDVSGERSRVRWSPELQEVWSYNPRLSPIAVPRAQSLERASAQQSKGGILCGTAMPIETHESRVNQWMKDRQEIIDKERAKKLREKGLQSLQASVKAASDVPKLPEQQENSKKATEKTELSLFRREHQSPRRSASPCERKRSLPPGSIYEKITAGCKIESPQIMVTMNPLPQSSEVPTDLPEEHSVPFDEAKYKEELGQLDSETPSVAEDTPTSSAVLSDEVLPFDDNLRSLIGSVQLDTGETSQIIRINPLLPRESSKVLISLPPEEKIRPPSHIYQYDEVKQFCEDLDTGETSSVTQTSPLPEESSDTTTEQELKKQTSALRRPPVALIPEAAKKYSPLHGEKLDSSQLPKGYAKSYIESSAVQVSKPSGTRPRSAASKEGFPARHHFFSESIGLSTTSSEPDPEVDVQELDTLQQERRSTTLQSTTCGTCGKGCCSCGKGCCSCGKGCCSCGKGCSSCGKGCCSCGSGILKSFLPRNQVAPASGIDLIEDAAKHAKDD